MSSKECFGNLAATLQKFKKNNRNELHTNKNSNNDQYVYLKNIRFQKYKKKRFIYFLYQNKNALWVIQNKKLLQINICFNIRLVSTFKCILFFNTTRK